MEKNNSCTPAATNEVFYAAYSLIERRFPARRLPILDACIAAVAQGDKRKADFLRLLTIDMVPDDLRPGGDYNTPRIEAALDKLDISTLCGIPDGSGDFMLGVLYARGVLRFPNREITFADTQKALAHFRAAKEKGCPAADGEIAFCQKK